jgi:NTE family protein
MTVAFALSGGGNLGPMQAGSIVALMEAGIRPDLLVGTSVGALNAAFLATRPGVAGARALMEAWSALKRPEAVRLDFFTALAGFLGFRNHLISDQQLRKLIRRWVEIDRIEQATTVPIAITTTDALTGDCVVLTTGDISDSLAASCAIPGLFPPVSINGRWLVDGGLSANQPVLQAQALGADDIFIITTAAAASPWSDRVGHELGVADHVAGFPRSDRPSLQGG